MPMRHTNGVFPGGGSVTLQGLPGRRSFRFQNQSQAQVASVLYASGFTVAGIPPGGQEQSELRAGADPQRLQGAIILNGTPGEPYDAEETYS